MDKPTEKLRILLLEDVPLDAELLELALRDAGLEFTSLRVDTRDAFEQALHGFKPGIVLADCKLPAYSGREALEYTRRAQPELPVIMVTGALGDEAAVELLKLGARDYVLKDHLTRLAPAIQRALSEAQIIRESKQAQEALQANEQRLQLAIRCGHMGVWDLDLINHTTYRSLEHDQIFGYASLLPRWTFEMFLDHILAEERSAVTHVFNAAVQSQADWDFECRIRRADGEVRWIWAKGSHQRDSEGTMRRMVGIVQDITERKQAEARLRRANRALKTLSAGNLALVRAASEDELLREVTNIIVQQGGYLLAAVDYADDTPGKSITPTAWSGMTDQQYWAQHLSWDDMELGQLPISKAIRDGATHICQDIGSDPAFTPWREAALARGYVSNIALPLSSDGKVFGGLSIYSSEAIPFDAEEVRLLEELANDLAYGIIALRTRVERERQTKLLRQSLEQFIQAIASTVEARDPYTAGHQRRVCDLATGIAREMDLPEEQVVGIHLAAAIIDLGKIRVPAEILSKPGMLTPIERELIKTHAQAGYDILKDVKFPWPIADIILQHHERLDGSGYPLGLRDGQILLEAKIMAVADVVEAMSSHRPYRPALGIDAALEEITGKRGVLYDPTVADACTKLFRERDYQLPA